MSAWPLIVALMSVWLLLTKIPDFWTTWRGLRQSSLDLEQNRLARALFRRLGLPLVMVALGAIYTGSVLGTAWQMMVLPERWQWPCGILFLALATFIGVVNLEVARVNATYLAGRPHPGTHPWPLRTVLTLASRLYRP